MPRWYCIKQARCLDVVGVYRRKIVEPKNPRNRAVYLMLVKVRASTSSIWASPQEFVLHIRYVIGAHGNTIYDGKNLYSLMGQSPRIDAIMYITNKSKKILDNAVSKYVRGLFIQR